MKYKMGIETQVLKAVELDSDIDLDEIEIDALEDG